MAQETSAEQPSEGGPVSPASPTDAGSWVGQSSQTVFDWEGELCLCRSTPLAVEVEEGKGRRGEGGKERGGRDKQRDRGREGGKEGRKERKVGGREEECYWRSQMTERSVDLVQK